MEPSRKGNILEVVLSLDFCYLVRFIYFFSKPLVTNYIILTTSPLQLRCHNKIKLKMEEK